MEHLATEHICAFFGMKIANIIEIGEYLIFDVSHALWMTVFWCIKHSVSWRSCLRCVYHSGRSTDLPILRLDS